MSALSNVSLPPSSARNAIEIQMFGLQRSGNHGVAAWVFRQFEQPAWFLNNVSHFTDPFETFRFADLPNTVRLPAPRDAKIIERLRHERKEILVYSYENLNLRELEAKTLIDDHDHVLGPSGIFRRILLLRDFYNWIASRIKLLELRSIPLGQIEQSADSLVNTWLLYACEFIGRTSFLGTRDVVKISYNRWTRQEAYREGLLRSLGLPNKDNSTSVAPRIGGRKNFEGGSSFDAAKLSSEAEKMTVEDRWRYLLEPQFVNIRERLKARSGDIDKLNVPLFDAACPFFCSGKADENSGPASLL